MPEHRPATALDLLRGSSRAGASDSIRIGESAPGLERAEVHLSSYSYAPHRHDTYGLGMTTMGVQRFSYRGSSHVCLPGQLHVLHPDELHDGAAGTDEGFGYRILYVAPELLMETLGGAPLPFVDEPVHDPSPATGDLVSLLAEVDDPLSDLGRVEAAVVVSDALLRLSGRPPGPSTAVDVHAVQLARDYLAAHATEPTPASRLEQVTGTDRFTLARHFRRALGTSPDRYRMMRRLDLARAAIERGAPLAAVAAATGFADQSHMTRQFKRAFGLTPTRWAVLTGSEHAAPRGGISPPGTPRQGTAGDARRR